MGVRADVDRKFIRRFLWIALACFGLMLWSLYDALVTYPNEIVRATEYKKLHKQVEAGELTDEQGASQWETLIAANNWAKSKPKDPEIVAGKLKFQWFLFGAGLILGTFFLVKYLRLLSSWMEADEKGLKTSWDQELTFNAITKVNKRRWKSKGIATVDYLDEAGQKKTMVLDDFKYHRETIGKILRMAESGLRDDQIIGSRETDDFGEVGSSDEFGSAES